MKFFILGGLPGSGKSTYAKELKRQEHCFVVCPDAIRRALNAGIYPRNSEYQTLEPLVWRLAEQAVTTLLQQGHNVAIDGTHLYKARRRRWINLARSINPEVTINTDSETPEESAKKVLDKMIELGYVDIEKLKAAVGTEDEEKIKKRLEDLGYI